MPRSVDQAHRDRLLDAVVSDLVQHGLPGASLERLASAAGTSARMLVHHFGSRHALLNAALTVARERELARARTVLSPGPDFVRVLGRAWSWFSSEEANGYFRLFGQVAASNRLGEPVYSSVSRSQLSTEWLTLMSDGFISAGCRPAAARRLSTMVIAQVRGLLLDLDATGDKVRVSGTYRGFVSLLEHDPELTFPRRRA